MYIQLSLCDMEDVEDFSNLEDEVEKILQFNPDLENNNE